MKENTEIQQNRQNPETNEKTWTEFLFDTSQNVGNTERVISSLAGGGLIAYGLSRKDWLGALIGLVGGGLALRGATGHCQLYDALDIDTKEKSLLERGKDKTKSWFGQNVEVVKSVLINKPAEELYSFWRNFENLPVFMNHLEAVKVIDAQNSEWTAKAPLGMEVSWKAVISEDRPNELIAWHSTEDSQIPNSGKVEFLSTPDRGTMVKVIIKYVPPAGKIGELAAYFLTEEPDTQVTDDLRRFKRLMETDVIMKIEGQPSGREGLPKTKVVKA